MAALKGGYRFRLFEGTPEGTVAAHRVGGRVVVPLAQGEGYAALPVVSPGDAVAAGQVIGTPPAQVGSPVHAPIDGVVRELAVKARAKQPWAIVIERDAGKAAPPAPDTRCEWTAAAPEALAEALTHAGVAALVPGGMIAPGLARVLVAVCVHTAPLLPRAGAVYAGRENDLVTGGRILAKALGAQELCFAVGRRDRAFAAALAGGGAPRVAAIDEVYPGEHPKLLVRAVAGGAADVVCVSGRAALAAYDAAVKGAALINVRLCLGGAGLARPAIVDARVGTPLGELCADRLAPGREVRYVAGNFLTGVAVPPEHPVTRDLECVSVLPEDRERRFLEFMRPGARKDSYGRTFLAAFLKRPLAGDTNLHGELRPCINCGWCEDVCPVGLMPDLLMKLLRIDQGEEAEALALMDCIECGLCSYVCPSKLPLHEELARGKRAVREELAQ